jgi:hypothetical protein
MWFSLAMLVSSVFVLPAFFQCHFSASQIDAQNNILIGALLEFG